MVQSLRVPTAKIPKKLVNEEMLSGSSWLEMKEEVLADLFTYFYS